MATPPRKPPLETVWSRKAAAAANDDKSNTDAGPTPAAETQAKAEVEN